MGTISKAQAAAESAKRPLRKLAATPNFKAMKDIPWEKLGAVQQAGVRAAVKRADQLGKLNASARDAYLEGFLSGLIS